MAKSMREQVAAAADACIGRRQDFVAYCEGRNKDGLAALRLSEADKAAAKLLTVHRGLFEAAEENAAELEVLKAFVGMREGRRTFYGAPETKQCRCGQPALVVEVMPFGGPDSNQFSGCVCYFCASCAPDVEIKTIEFWIPGFYDITNLTTDPNESGAQS